MTFLSKLFLGFVLLLPLALRAADEPRKQLSDTVSTQLPTLRTLAESKKFPEALRLIDSLLPAVAEGSFDLTLLRQIKSQILISQGNYLEAVTAIERLLAEGGPFLDAKARLDQLYLLSQLYYQQAGAASDDTARAALLTRASSTLEKWFALAPATTAEAKLFSADLLYHAATTGPLNREKLQLSLAEAQASLRLQVRANLRACVLILAVYQQLGDRVASAETLEFLVARQTDNEAYWQQLAATYTALAADTKDETAARAYTLRAALTVERAQAAGRLRSSKENLNLVALYFNLQEHARATALLSDGLRTGAIENTRRNWELLASVNQQARRIPEALAALEQAIAAFPREGQLEFALAQILYTEGRPEDALPRLENAVAKGNLDKPGQVRLFLGYVAYELKHYEAALRWSTDATAFADVKKDDLAKLTLAARAALGTPAARL